MVGRSGREGRAAVPARAWPSVTTARMPASMPRVEPSFASACTAVRLSPTIWALAATAGVALQLLQPALWPGWRYAVLGVAAVLLNWVTTGDHLLRTIGSGYWPVAGVDLAILASALLAVLAARKLRRRAQGQLGTDGAAAPSLEAARA